MSLRTRMSAMTLPLAKALGFGQNGASRTPARAPVGEMGVTGLRRWGPRGRPDEEFLPELQGTRAFKIYREMADNDPDVSSALLAIRMLMRQAKWTVEGPDEQGVAFLESCKDGMEHSWSDFIDQNLSMLIYGFSVSETVYGRRDGRVVWRKLPIRSQDSLYEWEWGEHGEVVAFVQQSPPKYDTVRIPMTRLLHFRPTSFKDSPEGRSLLRGMYRAWYYRKNIETMEAIGIERDNTGTPVIYRDAETAGAYDEQFKQILRNFKVDDQGGILLPMVLDERGNQLVKLELLGAPGKRQFDIGETIHRKRLEILQAVLFQMLILGQRQVGSYALASSHTELASMAIGAWLEGMADTINREGVARLWALNGLPEASMPRLVPGDVEIPDLDGVGLFIQRLGSVGLPMFPSKDGKLEAKLFDMAGLPVPEADLARMTEVMEAQQPPQPVAQPGGVE